MGLHKYFRKIDSLEFQVQFSVLSGFSSLRRYFARDLTLTELIAEAMEDITQSSCSINEHIRHLLDRHGPRMNDESIAAYLYCLKQIDLAVAQEASQYVLNKGGVWWSVRMALHILQYEDQIKESISFSSTENNKVRYSTGNESTIDNSSNTVEPAKRFMFTKKEGNKHQIELAFAS